MKIGFIGQGWMGKSYADDFENRGYDVVRYSLEPEYVKNVKLILGCDLTFIAVPTPTTQDGFDDSVIRSALGHIGNGKTVVIKSTIVPGTTVKFQKEFPDIFIFHSPEFLVEKTAAYDAACPNRNIIGTPIDSEEYKKKAHEILDVLPDAPYKKIMDAKDAEVVKYAGNCFLFTKVIFMNLLYDIVGSIDGNWDSVREALVNDPRIGTSHTEPVHDGGRGAGGHCFIKDFEAFRRAYSESVGDKFGLSILDALSEKNINLLLKSGKNLELLEGVYGDLSKYK